jgi:hypothetical protein
MQEKTIILDLGMMRMSRISYESMRSETKMLPNLRPCCLESPVKSRGTVRCDYIWGKTRDTCEDARHNRNVLDVPRYSMVNVVSADLDRNDNLLRFSIFPLGYTNFIKIKHQADCMFIQVDSDNARRSISIHRFECSMDIGFI